MKKIEKLDITDPIGYIGWLEGATSLPDSIEPYTKQALIMIRDKINEIIKELNRSKANRKILP